MIPGRVQIFRVTLPVVKPLKVGAELLRTREVLRILLEDETGKRYADCSPLPFFHKESLADCFKAAVAYFKGVAGNLPVSLSTTIDALSYPSSLDNLPSGEWENSGLLGLKDYEAPSLPRICKVKVGGSTLSELREVLDRLLAKNSSHEFRIDGNQLLNDSLLSDWRDLVRTFPIQYIEEPYASLDKLREIAKTLPIALDENLGRDPKLDALAKAWIIKPNRLGWRETIRRFQDSSDVAKVLSNTYEANASLQLYAHAYRQYVLRPEALGFGTAYYFADQNTEWNPCARKGAWPRTPFAKDPFEGDLIWAN